MSTAYYIVLNSEEPGFDPFVDGKALTRQLAAVNKIASSLGLEKLEDFAFHDLSDFGGPELEPTWFDAAAGTEWASRVLEYIRENPDALKDVDAIVGDLQGYISVFSEADKRGLKWHLALDF